MKCQSPTDNHQLTIINWQHLLQEQSSPSSEPSSAGGRSAMPMHVSELKDTNTSIHFLMEKVQIIMLSCHNHCLRYTELS
jgi:hypothetical protein